MIVNIVDLGYVLAVKAEDDPIVSGNLGAPESRQIAFEGVDHQSGKGQQVLWQFLYFVQQIENAVYLVDLLGGSFFRSLCDQNFSSPLCLKLTIMAYCSV